MFSSSFGNFSFEWEFSESFHTKWVIYWQCYASFCIQIDQLNCWSLFSLRLIEVSTGQNHHLSLTLFLLIIDRFATFIFVWFLILFELLMRQFLMIIIFLHTLILRNCCSFHFFIKKADKLLFVISYYTLKENILINPLISHLNIMKE